MHAAVRHVGCKLACKLAKKKGDGETRNGRIERFVSKRKWNGDGVSVCEGGWLSLGDKRRGMSRQGLFFLATRHLSFLSLFKKQYPTTKTKILSNHPLSITVRRLGAAIRELFLLYLAAPLLLAALCLDSLHTSPALFLARSLKACHRSTLWYRHFQF